MSSAPAVQCVCEIREGSHHWHCMGKIKKRTTSGSGNHTSYFRRWRLVPSPAEKFSDCSLSFICDLIQTRKFSNHQNIRVCHLSSPKLLYTNLSRSCPQAQQRSLQYSLNYSSTLTPPGRDRR